MGGVRLPRGVQEVEGWAENTVGSQNVRLWIGGEDRAGRSQLNQQTLPAGCGLRTSLSLSTVQAEQWELRLAAPGRRLGMGKDDRNIQEPAPRPGNSWSSGGDPADTPRCRATQEAVINCRAGEGHSGKTPQRQTRLVHVDRVRASCAQEEEMERPPHVHSSGLSLSLELNLRQPVLSDHFLRKAKAFPDPFPSFLPPADLCFPLGGQN